MSAPAIFLVDQQAILSAAVQRRLGIVEPVRIRRAPGLARVLSESSFLTRHDENPTLSVGFHPIISPSTSSSLADWFSLRWLSWRVMSSEAADVSAAAMAGIRFILPGRLAIVSASSTDIEQLRRRFGPPRGTFRSIWPGSSRVSTI